LITTTSVGLTHFVLSTYLKGAGQIWCRWQPRAHNHLAAEEQQLTYMQLRFREPEHRNKTEIEKDTSTSPENIAQTSAVVGRRELHQLIRPLGWVSLTARKKKRPCKEARKYKK
jgi:hypothetical protein